MIKLLHISFRAIIHHSCFFFIYGLISEKKGSKKSRLIWGYVQFPPSLVRHKSQSQKKDIKIDGSEDIKH